MNGTPSRATLPLSRRMPWFDRGGRFSALKAVCLALLLAPALWLAWEALAGMLGARPLTALIHESGRWAVRFLLASLAVTPARVVLNWPRVTLVRRMIGVAAAAYTLAHFALYTADQNFRWLAIGIEIVARFYLAVGFLSLVGLSALAATSTDAMLARLGRNWKRLHRGIHVLTGLALLHFLLSLKANITEPVLMAGFFIWLEAWRLLAARRQGQILALLALTLLAALATAAIEAGWYGLATHLDWHRVLAANWMPRYGVRPASVVALAGLGVIIAARLRRRSGDGRRPPRFAPA
jgi:sulfoxide reductase heme-binding subunit YedZ